MDKKPTRFEALTRAVLIAGGQSEFARALGTHQPNVWRWINQSKQLPAEYVLLVEELYDVPRWELRPDLYPPREYMTDQGHGPRFIGVDRDAIRMGC